MAGTIALALYEPNKVVWLDPEGKLRQAELRRDLPPLDALKEIVHITWPTVDRFVIALPNDRQEADSLSSALAAAGWKAGKRVCVAYTPLIFDFVDHSLAVVATVRVGHASLTEHMRVIGDAAEPPLLDKAFIIRIWVDDGLLTGATVHTIGNREVVRQVPERFEVNATNIVSTIRRAVERRRLRHVIVQLPATDDIPFEKVLRQLAKQPPAHWVGRTKITSIVAVTAHPLLALYGVRILADAK